MKNEKEKETEKTKSNPIDTAKSIAEDIQKRIAKAKITKTKDRRPKIPAGVPTPPGFNHPRMIKRNGGSFE